MSKNIILIGFMGSGKTSVAKALHQESLYPVLDTDKLIEAQEGCSIYDLFKTKGEAYFREQEHALCKDLLDKESHIIATGGGFPLLPPNQDRLKDLGMIVYLDTSLPVIEERLQEDDSRPLYQNPALFQVAFKDHPHPFKTLYYDRQPQYQALANFSVQTEDKTPEEIAKLIWTRYNDD